MNVLIAGGTGFIGSYISKRFIENGYQVKLVSRNSEHVNWTENALIEALETSDILINLAGKSINCKHTAKNRTLILKSRIETTEMLGKAIQKCKNAPKIWINASASAIYKSNLMISQTESQFEIGTGFLADTVAQWEKTFFDFNLPNTRQVALRTSVVLGKNGGAFQPIKLLTVFGLGGTLGSGKQYFSWIHLEDYFRIIDFAIQNKKVTGAINATSPNPLPNRDFMKGMRAAIGCKIGVPAPEFAIRAVSGIINTEPELLLDSVNFYPENLINNGFLFKFGECKEAIKELIQ